MDQLLDLLAGQLAAARQLGEHPLAVGAGLLDHLPTLLLGHRQLGLGVGGGVGAAAAGLEVGLLAQPLGLVGGLAQQPRRAVLGLDADRRAALAGGLQEARRLLAEQAGGRVLVHRRTVAGPEAWAARSSRSRKRSRSCSRASSAATMRRKSRTSCWSKPRRAVPNAASATAAGEDGSGRENEMAIAAKRKRGTADRGNAAVHPSVAVRVRLSRSTLPISEPGAGRRRAARARRAPRRAWPRG